MNNELIGINKRFDSINGIRTLACISILIMHVKANGDYSIGGYITNLIIGELGNFVFLFMIISSFGMCCGYFDKIKNNEISTESFYSRRIRKILPFFLFLIIFDIIIERNIASIIEGFADFTLLFGFLQKDITVIGVAWFLGLIFIFYIMFPYFTYLFSNKYRAWITTIIALLMNISCVYYFNTGRKNMFYSFIYFCVGGLIYIYRDAIINLFKKNKIIGIFFIVISTLLYFLLPMKNEYIFLFKAILLSSSLLCYAISYNSKVLNNKVTQFIGNISFEIYLCHMVVFRIAEKIKLVKLFDNLWLSYVGTSIIVILGSLCMSIIFKKISAIIEKRALKI